MAQQKQNQQDKQPRQPRQPKQQQPKQPNRQGRTMMYVYLAIFAVLGVMLFWGGSESGPVKAEWEEVEPILLKQHEEKVVVVNKEFAEIHIKKDVLHQDPSYSKLITKGSSEARCYQYRFLDLDSFKEDLKAIEEQTGQRVKVVPETRVDKWGNFLMGPIGTILFFVLIWWLISRMSMKAMGGAGPMGGIFNVGKSKAKLHEGKTPTDITFKDVAGLAGAKEEVMEVVDFLKNPKRYTDLGGKIPKGVLLVGPPGTGKTLLAKAVAGEAHVPFFSMSGSEFVEMFVGVGASRVRDLFNEAKKKSPCIIFIDEIDAVGRSRGHGAMSNANDERESTLNQLLTEMDGFTSNTNIIVLAATNRADVLDKALLRAGRFDRQIYVELPDLEERKAIFEVHMKKLKLGSDIDRDFLAKQTPGFSGADIANVCNESALVAARLGHKEICKQDFLDAIDRIIGGLEKRTKVMTDQEKRTIAYHESGHASVSWLLRWGDPLVKVTIVPRGKALGAAWYLPEERQLTTKEQLVDSITSLMAGRAAEEVVFGRVSTGALNDMERATKMAQGMVLYYGMSEKIGNISYYDSQNAGDWAFTKPYSDETARLIDDEVKRIVEEAYAHAKTIITNHRAQIDELAQTLFEREVIFKDDVERIFGPRPWEQTPQLEEPITPEIPAPCPESQS